MHFSKIITFLSLMAVGLAAPAPEAEADALAKRGFGCPDDGPCNEHCTTIGRKGGYCGGPFWQECICNQ